MGNHTGNPYSLSTTAGIRELNPAIGQANASRLAQTDPRWQAARDRQMANYAQVEAMRNPDAWTTGTLPIVESMRRTRGNYGVGKKSTAQPGKNYRTGRETYQSALARFLRNLGGIPMGRATYDPMYYRRYYGQ